MHALGHPADTDAVREVCDSFGIPLIEDAAESIGSYYKGKHTGNVGLVAALSFNGNKVVTTGGGGALLTNDSELARKAKHLTTTAKKAHPWEFVHDEVGFNYRLPNLNAALGCAQLEQLPRFLEKKRVLAARYEEMFADSEARFLREPGGTRSNYWLCALVLKRRDRAALDATLKAAHEKKLLLRPVWRLIPELEMYKACPKDDLSCAESLQDRVLCLPSSAFLEPMA